jgi:hypothetical protein
LVTTAVLARAFLAAGLAAAGLAAALAGALLAWDLVADTGVTFFVAAGAAFLAGAFFGDAVAALVALGIRVSSPTRHKGAGL